MACSPASTKLAGGTGNPNAAYGSNAGRDVTGNGNTALGQEAGRNVQGDSNLAMGQNVQGSNNMALGSGAKAVQGSVALGAGSQAVRGASQEYVAYGLDGVHRSQGEVNLGGRQLTGLAPGSEETDAVNVAQLRAASQATETRFGESVRRLDRDLQSQERKLSAGVAAAMATAALPQAYLPGRNMVSLAGEPGMVNRATLWAFPVSRKVGLGCTRSMPTVRLEETSGRRQG